MIIHGTSPAPPLRAGRSLYRLRQFSVPPSSILCTAFVNSLYRLRQFSERGRHPLLGPRSGGYGHFESLNLALKYFQIQNRGIHTGKAAPSAAEIAYANEEYFSAQHNAPRYPGPAPARTANIA